MRIRHALGRKFELRPAALPSLRVVQNILHHYRRTRLGGNDKRKAIVEAVRRAAFSGREDDHDAFTFTSDYDECRTRCPPPTPAPDQPLQATDASHALQTAYYTDDPLQTSRRRSRKPLTPPTRCTRFPSPALCAANAKS
ncbi:hypothetical protein GQ600_6355 [Phytophthora cactorum]|nr:hypothetical protein GQ600_6355 [Phytophthora cactorum]